MTTGSRSNGLIGAAPPNLHTRQFVPQGALLGRCHLVVAHGGAGSVLGALRYGVPMVLIPLGADHADNADQVERSGAGVKVGADSSPEAIRAVVTSVLDDDCFRTAARSLRDEIAVVPEPAAVAVILEELVCD